MNIRLRYLGLIVLFVGLCASQSSLFGQNLGDGVRHGFNQLMNRMPFVPKKDNNIEKLAKEIGWLESYIDKYGSIVAKSPDVWGEARLTKHRFEYEQVLRERLNSFDFTINGAIDREDLSYLVSVVALSASLDATSKKKEIGFLAKSLYDSTNNTTQKFSDGKLTENTNNTTQAVLDEGNANFADTVKPTTTRPTVGANGPNIGLEPQVYLDQLSRYLGHLHQLRRINEGDDTSTSPGYAMNLVRIPVSVLPGRATRKGYGAEITVTALPQMSPDLLPQTFRQLVINDITRLAGVPITRILNDASSKKDTLKLLLDFSRFDSNTNRLANQMNEWIDDMLAESKKKKKILAADYLNTLAQHDGYLHGRIRELQYKRDEIHKFELEVDLTALISKLEKKRKQYSYANEYAKVFGEIVNDLKAFFIKDKSNYNDTPKNKLPENNDEKVNDEKVNEKIKQLKDVEKAEVHITYSEIFRGISSALENYDLKKKGVLPELAQAKTSRNYSKQDKDAVEGGGGGDVEQPTNFSFVVKLNDDIQLDVYGNMSLIHSDRLNILKWPALPFEVSNLRIKPSEEVDSEVVKKIHAMLKAEVEEEINEYDGGISNALQEFLSDQGEYSRIASTFLMVPNGARVAQNPVSPTQLTDIMGFEYGEILVRRLNEMFAQYPGKDFPKKDYALVHYGDVKRVLHSELNAAYEYLSNSENSYLWAYASPTLETAIRSRDTRKLRSMRSEFQKAIISSGIRGSLTEALAWLVIVDSALLEARLKKDIKSVFAENGFEFDGSQHSFVGMEPLQCSRECFNEYVRLRWPIRVFALDPVSSEQNISDKALRRREMQLAFSMALVSQKISIDNFNKFSRLMDSHVDTIALNRTVVGFSHGENTFGWRFAPRLQTPKAPSNIQAMYEDVFGATDNMDKRQLSIEPGARECTAIVLMPSFVKSCEFDVRTNWFGIANPRNTDLTMPKIIHLSRSIEKMRSLAHECVDCAHLYRENELGRMINRVEQLEKELPLQTMRIPIPHENTLGGFQLFNNGVTDLAPELNGWYGAPGVYVITDDGPTQPAISPTDEVRQREVDGTTVFLIGNNLSVHDTQVITGGIHVERFQLISREIMKITLPADCQTVESNGKKFVDVHASTPYGVTSHLLIPVVEDKKAKEKEAAEKLDDRVKKLESSGISLDTKKLQATFKIDEKKQVSDIAFDASVSDLILKNSQTGSNADKMLGAPKKLRIALQITLEKPAKIEGFVVIGTVEGEDDDKIYDPKVFDYDNKEHQFKIASSDIMNSINEQLGKKFNELTETTYGDIEKLEASCSVYVLIDQDKQPSILSDKLEIEFNELKKEENKDEATDAKPVDADSKEGGSKDGDVESKNSVKKEVARMLRGNGIAQHKRSSHRNESRNQKTFANGIRQATYSSESSFFPTNDNRANFVPLPGDKE